VCKKIRQQQRSKSIRDAGLRRRRLAPPPADPSPVAVTCLRIVARNRLRPGTVVWVRVPFKDTEGDKIRPAVVLSCRGRDVVLLPCTTSVRRHQRPGYVEIKHWQAAGLPRPTGVRRASLTVDYLEIVNIAGDLADEDAAAVLPLGARPRPLLPLPAEGDPAA
jgi:PemK-like, MazF-like toxin of type II toxin-antitoxin system